MGHFLRYLPMNFSLRLFLYASGIDTDDDFTPFSKFDGIPDEVHKILIHTCGITEYRGALRVYQTVQL